MGQNTVAVLYNDHSAEIEASGDAGKRIAKAMRDWGPVNRDGYFGSGQVISRDSSAGFQLVLVHGNTGWRLGLDEFPAGVVLPVWACEHLAAVLKRQHWEVKPPRRGSKR